MFKKFIHTAIIASVSLAPALSFAGTDQSSDQKKQEDQQDTKYIFQKEIDIQHDLTPILGQLSPDGSTMYLSMEKDLQKQLYAKEWKSKSGSFGKARKLEGPVNHPKYNAVTATVSENEKTMVFVGSENGTQQGNDLYIATRQSEKEPFANIRKLSEVNTKGKSDMHPWLSTDGLRLYFTKQNGDKIHFYQASRTNPNEEFISIEKLQIDIPHISNNLSCLFTNHEKVAYVVSDNKMYRSERKDLHSDFSKPRKVAEFDDASYINGMTMTADQSELYIFDSEGFKDIHIKKYINQDKQNKPAVAR